MKQHVSFLVAIFLVVAMLSGCSGTIDNSSQIPVATAESPSDTPTTPNTSSDSNTQTTNTNEPSSDVSVDAEPSVVYFTSDISSEGLIAIYEALNFEATGNVAVKLSTGEPPNSNYLRPELIKELVQSLGGNYC